MIRISARGKFSNSNSSGKATESDIDDVEVVLFNPIQNSRRIILDAVHDAGFRRVNVMNSIETLRHAVRDAGLDMLALETKEHVETLCEHIQVICHGRLDSNPLLVISVITWKPGNNVIRTCIDTGTNDINVIPISIGAIAKRVDNFIQNRKNFVATPRYIGPARRQIGRGNDSAVAGFDVPNGWRYKATGIEMAKVDMARIERANSIIREHRLHRTAL